MTPRTRPAALVMAAAGILFLLYPAFRPWHDESTLAGAQASMGSAAWVASHLFAMLGFVLLPLGLLGLRGIRLGMPAVVVTWIGAGLTLPYYGAEDFGLYAVARAPGADLLGISESFRYDPVAISMFGAGLLTLAVGTTLAAVAVWRSGRFARFSAIPLALGFILFLPQFFTPPAVRIGHGVLVFAGCLWLAAELWRNGSAGSHQVDGQLQDDAHRR